MDMVGPMGHAANSIFWNKIHEVIDEKQKQTKQKKKKKLFIEHDFMKLPLKHV